jgi:hypothetical protein
MTEPLDRDDVIELLKRLGGDRDEDVLEAARQVHVLITAAGMTWEELLVPDEAAGDSDDSDAEDHDLEDEDADAEDYDLEDEDVDAAEDHDLADEDAEPPGDKAKKNAESLALIDKLLAGSGISEDFREELTDYKTDIAEGDFGDADHRYIRALYKRLSKQR